uniref:Uncharacterized protein n=1 Tax=Suricata suricatta TaxID=37032 RepID=A0A673T4E0_SURSU
AFQVIDGLMFSRTGQFSGGELSNCFIRPEKAVPSSRPNRKASSIFGPIEEPQDIPKRTKLPGSRSVIFLRNHPNTLTCLTYNETF